MNEEEYHSVVENMRMTVSFTTISCPTCEYLLQSCMYALCKTKTAYDFYAQSQPVSCMRQSKCVAIIIVADG